MNKLILALDNITPDIKLINSFKNSLAMVKVGLELFIYNQNIISELELSIFLDLKLHDIPNTVEKAITAACKRFSPTYITVHAMQRESILRGIEAAGKYGCELVVVTCLTSQDPADMYLAGSRFKNARDQVSHVVEVNMELGIKNFVCSGFEADIVKNFEGISFVPGIRLNEVAGDQKRSMGPEDAIQAGANYLIMGREINNSIDPDYTINKINELIRSY